MPELMRFALGLAAAGALLGWLLRIAARRLGCARPGWAIGGGALAALVPVLLTLGNGRTLVPTGDLPSLLPDPPAGLEPADAYDRGLNDAALQFLPWEHEVRRLISAGHFPFWSDRLSGGDDLWSNPQAQVASPLAWLARAAPLDQHLLAALALRVLTGFAGAALLARRFGLPRFLAGLSGAAFGLGGATLGFAVFPHGGSGAFVPWLALVGLHLARARRVRNGAKVATALLAAAAALGGHPVTALGAFASAIVFGLASRRATQTLRSALAPLVLPLLCGAMLSAPWNLPFLVALERAQGRGVGVDQANSSIEGRAAPGTPAASATIPVPVSVTAALVEPFAPLKPDYPGAEPARAWLPAVSVYSGIWLVPGLVAAIAATLSFGGRGRALRRRVLPPLAFALPLWALALTPPGWLGWKASVPILRTFQIPRLAPAILLALILVAACGLASLLRRRSAPVALLAIASAALLGLAGRPGLTTIAALVCFFLLWSFFQRFRGPATLGFLALAAVDYGSFQIRALPRGEPRAVYPESAWIARMAAEAHEGGPWRVGATGFRLYPSILAVYGLEDVRTQNPPLVPGDQARALEAGLGMESPLVAYFTSIRRPEHPLLDFLGVRYLAAGYDEPIPSGMQRVRGTRLDGTILLRNNEALPRWFLAAGAAQVPESELSGWLAALQDPRVVALDPRDGEWTGSGESYAEVRVMKLEDGRALLELPPRASPALLATSLPHWQGWRKANSGSLALRTRRIHGAYLGVEIPPGTARVELRYRPPGLLSGIAAGLAAALLLAFTARRPSQTRTSASRALRETIAP